jgi:hypothetical protein
MAGFGPEGERPRDAFPISQHKRPEQAEPQQARPAASPLAHGSQEQWSWQERPHEELVAAFRQAIRLKFQEVGERAKYFTPAKLIRYELEELERWRRLSGVTVEQQQRAEAIGPIYDAWLVITYAHHGKGYPVISADGKEVNYTGFIERARTGSILSCRYRETGQSTIRLSEPQRRILEALAEAADIPYQKGQTEIEIPEKLREYGRWHDEINPDDSHPRTRMP